MNIDININSILPKDFASYKLVDIREANETAMYPAATDQVYVWPMSEFETNQVNFKKGEQYLIFCAAGGRSHRMAEYLNEQGIKAFSVNQGINAVNAYLKEHSHAR